MQFAVYQCELLVCSQHTAACPPCCCVAEHARHGASLLHGCTSREEGQVKANPGSRNRSSSNRHRRGVGGYCAAAFIVIETRDGLPAADGKQAEAPGLMQH